MYTEIWHQQTGLKYIHIMIDSDDPTLYAIVKSSNSDLFDRMTTFTKQNSYTIYLIFIYKKKETFLS